MIDLFFVHTVHIDMPAVHWQIQQDIVNLLLAVLTGWAMSLVGIVRLGNVRVGIVLVGIVVEPSTIFTALIPYIQTFNTLRPGQYGPLFDLLICVNKTGTSGFVICRLSNYSRKSRYLHRCCILGKYLLCSATFTILRMSKTLRCQMKFLIRKLFISHLVYIVLNHTQSVIIGKIWYGKWLVYSLNIGQFVSLCSDA